ncbi:thiamine phosphate synthase [Myroides albus]|uniref:Thiamine-phosphate synthase n=1 Tax=Myroides albus TaxID=2562892 RepID=A0A6I3LGQ6_9FLAO|nr:thiamine phosphate synthase [Myroides albus]MTG98739.1 thiamine phosphate synthase [Myroides albus]UVD79062.1 thiamine phosphate synthase [Myroides albus]
MRQLDLSLYLVTDRECALGRDIVDIVEQAVQGGVTIVQLREKQCDTKQFYNIAVRLKECLKPYDVPLIINDRVDIALACDAQGVHIGQSDMPYQVVRRLLGPDKIIGLSVSNAQQLEYANTLDVDYIGLSPVFDTTTKKDTSKAIGIEGVRDFSRKSKHLSVGIGGINVSNAEQVIHAGADGISLVSAIISADKPKLAAAELLNIVKQTKNNM